MILSVSVYNQDSLCNASEGNANHHQVSTHYRFICRVSLVCFEKGKQLEKEAVWEQSIHHQQWLAHSMPDVLGSYRWLQSQHGLSSSIATEWLKSLDSCETLENSKTRFSWKRMMKTRNEE